MRCLDDPVVMGKTPKYVEGYIRNFENICNIPIFRFPLSLLFFLHFTPNFIIPLNTYWLICFSHISFLLSNYTLKPFHQNLILVTILSRMSVNLYLYMFVAFVSQLSFIFYT